MLSNNVAHDSNTLGLVEVIDPWLKIFNLKVVNSQYPFFFRGYINLLIP